MEKVYKHNRFHICRHAIGLISEEREYDVNTAAMDFAIRMDWEIGIDENGRVGEHNAEYEEFLAHVRDLQALVEPGEYDNAVKRYFHEV